MEITTHLPITQWYFYDIEWWGLDYPPVTAYHSWVLGKLGALIKSEWFALDYSRGLDDPSLKIFMRATVIASEYLVYIPAVVVLIQKLTRIQSNHTWNATVALTAILLQPSLILIDHVHFQYNNVMLGFVIACMSSILSGKFISGCIFFVLALGFKQMALYYAPALSAYLLGICVFPKIDIPRILCIAIATLASFAALLLPMVLGALYDDYRGNVSVHRFSGKPAQLPLLEKWTYQVDSDTWYFPLTIQLLQVLHRIFPFSRGLFEDKVANFWCALNVVVKIRHLQPQVLQYASLIATSMGILPPCLIIFLRPRITALTLAFSTTAWAFFLFSFQVHEKSVLLPLMPMSFLLASKHGLNPRIRAWVGFANFLGVWTLYPLLQRVNLRIPYYVLSFLWVYLLGLPPTSLSLYFHDWRLSSLGSLTTFIHMFYYSAMGLWHLGEAIIIPPPDKPDLWTVFNVIIGATGFFVCYLWCLWNLILECGLSSAFSSEKAHKKQETYGEKLKVF